MGETPTEETKPLKGSVTRKVITIGGSEWTVRELMNLALLVLATFGIGANAIGNTQFAASEGTQQEINTKLDDVVELGGELKSSLGEVKHQVELQGKDLEALKVQQTGQADAIRKLQGDVDDLKKRE